MVILSDSFHHIVNINQLSQEYHFTFRFGEVRIVVRLGNNLTPVK